MKQVAEVFLAFLPAIVSTMFALLWWRECGRANEAKRELRAAEELLQIQSDVLELKSQTIAFLKENIEIRRSMMSEIVLTPPEFKITGAG